MQEENLREEGKKLFPEIKIIHDDNEFSRKRKTRWNRNFQRNENRCKSLEHINDVKILKEFTSALRTLFGGGNVE